MFSSRRFPSPGLDAGFCGPRPLCAAADAAMIMATTAAVRGIVRRMLFADEWRRACSTSRPFATAQWLQELLLLRRPWLRHAAVPFCEHGFGGHSGCEHLHFIFQPMHHAYFALHHGLESGLRHVCGIGLVVVVGTD